MLNLTTSFFSDQTLKINDIVKHAGLPPIELKSTKQSNKLKINLRKVYIFFIIRTTNYH